MPLVSIILPTRNRPDLLPRAVASVRAQTEPDFELLIVDNSPPGSRMAGGFGGDPRVRIVAAPNAVNAAGVRNAGLAAATGTWISFLDDDDAYRPAKLASQLALARDTSAPLVLCAGAFHLRGRVRVCYAESAVRMGDDLLNSAGLGAPFLLHRRMPGLRFDETLFAGEDAHYAQALLAGLSLTAVPVVREPLVDVYQDAPDRSRTNLRADAGWRAARRTWWQFGRRYSPAARRLFVMRALVTRAKLHGRPMRVARLAPSVLHLGGRAQVRFVLNALAVSSGFIRGRWVT